MRFTYLDGLTQADVAFEAVGASLGDVLEASWFAVLELLISNSGQIRPRVRKEVKLTEAAPDLLLLSFLQEEIFFKDAERLLLKPQAITVSEPADSGPQSFRLSAILMGEEFDPERHRAGIDVKAVTLHQLSLAFSQGQWRGVVLLDV